MSFFEHIKIIKRGLKYIIPFVLVTVLITTYLNIFVLKPVYSSTVSIYVMKKDGATSVQSIQYSDVMAIKHLVKDYSRIMVSRIIIEPVITDLALKITPEELIERIYVKHKTDTDIMEITVEDNSAMRAKIIANKIVDTFIKKINIISGNSSINVSVIDPAQIPKDKDKPRTLINILIAFIVSTSFTIGISYLREYFDVKLRSVEDIESSLGLRVLGTIPNIIIKDEYHFD